MPPSLLATIVAAIGAGLATAVVVLLAGVAAADGLEAQGGVEVAGHDLTQLGARQPPTRTVSTSAWCRVSSA